MKTDMEKSKDARERLINASQQSPHIHVGVQMFYAGHCSFEEAICEVAIVMSAEISRMEKRLIKIEMERETGAAAEIKELDRQILVEAAMSTMARPIKPTKAEPPVPVSWPADANALKAIRRLVDGVIVDYEHDDDPLRAGIVKGSLSVAMRVRDILNTLDALGPADGAS